MNITATVADVNLGGDLVFEGLMWVENGKPEFGVAVPQIARLFSFDLNQATRYLERLMGNSFRVRPMMTELNFKEVNVVLLLDFEFVVAKLDRRGNVKAQEFRDRLVGLSLRQLFSDSFGVDFGAKDRAKYLDEVSLTQVRNKARLTHGGFQAKCLNHKFPAKYVHDLATKFLVGRTATESINTLPINPELLEEKTYSNPHIGINHVRKSELKFLDTLAEFKLLFASKKPRSSENWESYTIRVLNALNLK